MGESVSCKQHAKMKSHLLGGFITKDIFQPIQCLLVLLLQGIHGLLQSIKSALTECASCNVHTAFRVRPTQANICSNCHGRDHRQLLKSPACSEASKAGASPRSRRLRRRPCPAVLALLR